MMKRFIGLVLLSTMLSIPDVHAVGSYKRCEEWVVNFGKSLESIDNIPVIGKLTNLLPFAVISTCLQQCPGQTIVVVASLFLYSLLKNDTAYLSLQRCIPKNNRSIKDEEIQLDDTLFDFEDNSEQGYQENRDGLLKEHVSQNSDLL